MSEGGYRDSELSKPKKWEWLSLVPMAAGLNWLLAHQSGHWLVLALLPGTLLLSTGTALLLMPGNPRITAYMAVGAVLGVLLSLIALPVGGFGTALLMASGSMASLLVSGRVALLQAPLVHGATPPELSLKLDLKAAIDEFVLGYFVISAQQPSAERIPPMCDAITLLEKTFTERGWDKDPTGFHPAPSPPEKIDFDSGRIFGVDYEVLNFDSGFAPDDTLPGAALWKGQARNNRCTVRVLRHEGPPRPWLFCIHGYRMGVDWLDLSLFPPAYLHQRLGLNIVQPVLPLHGPRRIGVKSGDKFLDDDFTNLIYAQAQALWDLRRTLAWVRAQEPAARVGVLGYSLGGYNASLLAAYEEKLDFVIAGIPVVDFATALWPIIPAAHRDYLEAQGLTQSRYRDLLKIVSPLELPCKLPKERRLIVAGAGDRIVPPWHPVQLSKHWDVPVSWYQGSHLSVRRERETRQVLKEAMLRSGWLVG